MSTESDLERWASKDWSTARGVEHFQYNNEVWLAKTSVDEVVQRLGDLHPGSRWESKILDRTILLGDEGFFVFRLTGHVWTEILYHCNRSALTKDPMEELCRHLKRAIVYRISDTADALEYVLYDNGAVLESFSSSEFGTEFSSKIRDVQIKGIREMDVFVNDFFVSEDAFEPGIEFRYFLTERYDTAPELVPGQPVKICNPGFILVAGFSEAISKPCFERIDYIGWHSCPPVSGRIS